MVVLGFFFTHVDRLFTNAHKSIMRPETTSEYVLGSIFILLDSHINVEQHWKLLQSLHISWQQSKCLCVWIFLFFECCVSSGKGAISQKKLAIAWAHTHRKAMSHFSKNSPHLVGTRQLPATVQSEGSADTRTCTVSRSCWYTYGCTHPQLHTSLYSHSFEMGTPCSPGFEPQNPKWSHLRH